MRKIHFVAAVLVVSLTSQAYGMFGRAMFSKFTRRGVFTRSVAAALPLELYDEPQAPAYQQVDNNKSCYQLATELTAATAMLALIESGSANANEFQKNMAQELMTTAMRQYAVKCVTH